LTGCIWKYGGSFSNYLYNFSQIQCCAAIVPTRTVFHPFFWGAALIVVWFKVQWIKRDYVIGTQLSHFST
jgi:hypothetical protein